MPNAEEILPFYIDVLQLSKISHDKRQSNLLIIIVHDHHHIQHHPKKKKKHTGGRECECVNCASRTYLE